LLPAAGHCNENMGGPESGNSTCSSAWKFQTLGGQGEPRFRFIKLNDMFFAVPKRRDVYADSDGKTGLFRILIVYCIIIQKQGDRTNHFRWVCGKKLFSDHIIVAGHLAKGF